MEILALTSVNYLVHPIIAVTAMILHYHIMTFTQKLTFQTTLQLVKQEMQK